MSAQVRNHPNLADDLAFEFTRVRGLQKLNRLLILARRQGLPVTVSRHSKSGYEVHLEAVENAQLVALLKEARRASAHNLSFQFDTGWVSALGADRRAARGRQSRTRWLFPVAPFLLLGLVIAGMSVLEMGKSTVPAGVTAAQTSPSVEHSSRLTKTVCGKRFARGASWQEDLEGDSSVVSDVDFGGRRYLQVRENCESKVFFHKLTLTKTRDSWVIENAVRSKETEPRF
jgi:hypothetical protein